MTSEVQLKAPGDSNDYTLSWTNLGGATVASVVHSVPAGIGITKVGESSTATTSTVQLSGGTHGQLVLVTGTATLSNGRTLVRTFPLRIFVS